MQAATSATQAKALSIIAALDSYNQALPIFRAAGGAGANPRVRPIIERLIALCAICDELAWTDKLLNSLTRNGARIFRVHRRACRVRLPQSRISS